MSSYNELRSQPKANQQKTLRRNSAAQCPRGRGRGYLPASSAKRQLAPKPALMAGFFMRGRIGSMTSRFRFSTGNALLATFWIAVWCAAIGAGNKPFMLFGGVVASAIFTFLLLVPPAAAVGSICGRPLLGLACGFASFVAMMLWMLCHGLW
jgi:hypothetical protein